MIGLKPSDFSVDRGQWVSLQKTIEASVTIETFICIIHHINIHTSVSEKSETRHNCTTPSLPQYRRDSCIRILAGKVCVHQNRADVISCWFLFLHSIS